MAEPGFVLRWGKPDKKEDRRERGRIMDKERPCRPNNETRSPNAGKLQRGGDPLFASCCAHDQARAARQA